MYNFDPKNIKDYEWICRYLLLKKFRIFLKGEKKVCFLNIQTFSKEMTIYEIISFKQKIF